MTNYLTDSQLLRALQTRDLTDPAQGQHAIQHLTDQIITALTDCGQIPVRLIRDSPLVTVADNYDRLGYDAGAITRDARYSHYVSRSIMLRSHTSAAIPPALDALADDPNQPDLLLAVPGLVHRRDAIDRTHVGAPHQLDLWRVSATGLGPDDLTAMIGLLVEAVLPGTRWRTIPADHPYTDGGRQVDVRLTDDWLELAECGLIPDWLLSRSGLDPQHWSGLALGMGLDRALMLRKNIPDIRYLRSTDPRVIDQLADLEPWRPVSTMPPVRRDISIVVDADTDAEILGDRARTALGPRADDLESMVVLASTPYDELPAPARDRLRITAGQSNLLVRLTLRPISHTLTDAEANQLRDAVYRALHSGPVLELIGAGADRAG